MSDMDRTSQLMIATGIVGYAIAMRLLTALRDLGVLSDESLIERPSTPRASTNFTGWPVTFSASS